MGYPPSDRWPDAEAHARLDEAGKEFYQRGIRARALAAAAQVTASSSYASFWIMVADFEKYLTTGEKP